VPVLGHGRRQLQHRRLRGHARSAATWPRLFVDATFHCHVRRGHGERVERERAAAGGLPRANA
jgi:hypothetical protein